MILSSYMTPVPLLSVLYQCTGKSQASLNTRCATWGASKWTQRLEVKRLEKELSAGRGFLPVG